MDACGDHDALRMIRKTDENLEWYRNAFQMYKSMPETPSKFINEKALSDMMLAERSLLYVGGAGSCMGCGEATALRMMLAATGFQYGQENSAAGDIPSAAIAAAILSSPRRRGGATTPIVARPSCTAQ